MIINYGSCPVSVCLCTVACCFVKYLAFASNFSFLSSISLAWNHNTYSIKIWYKIIQRNKKVHTIWRTKASSGPILGLCNKLRILVKRIPSVILIVQIPMGGNLNMLKQVLPLLFILGWYIGVINVTSGGSNG